MSDIGELHADERAFLEPYLPPASLQTTQNHDPTLPFVTLTYASSLDSMIALSPGARTTLSGPETKTMTHYLRLRHDAILIGAGTAAVDDPALNCRYPGATLEDQPRPVVVDPNTRWDFAGKKAYRLAFEGAGKGPWIITRDRAQPPEALRGVDGDYIVVTDDDLDPSGTADFRDTSSRIPWATMLRTLKHRGIESVMIEGGATVINDLLTMPELVDMVIITIAPTFLGQGGVFVSPAAKVTDGKIVNAAWLRETKWRQFGNDVVLCGALRHKSADSPKSTESPRRKQTKIIHINISTVSQASGTTRLDSNGTKQELPAVTLPDGSKVQTGSVGAMLMNIKLYGRVCGGEEIEGTSKEQLESFLVAPIPTLKQVGLFDLFPADEWVNGTSNSSGRIFVGSKAKEMGYQTWCRKRNYVID